MASFVRLICPVASIGFVRSIGPATIFPCSSSSPALHQLSSSRWDDLAFGDFGGDSSCLSCLLFSGGVLCFGAGGGGALLVLFSALVSAIAISISLRCACSRSSFSSCFIARSASFFSFPEVPEVSGQFFSRLFEFFAQFFYPDVFYLFFVLFPLPLGCFFLLGCSWSCA